MREYLSILDEIDDPYNPSADSSLQAGYAEIAKPAPAPEPAAAPAPAPAAATAPAGQAAMSYAGNQGGGAAKPTEPAASTPSGVEQAKVGIAAGSPAITGKEPAGNMQNAAAVMKAAQGGASPTAAAQAGVDAAAPAPAPAKQNTAAPASAGGYAQSATAADNNPAAAAPKPGDTTTAADGRTYTTQKGVMGQPDTQQRSYKSFGDFFNKLTGKGDVNGAVAAPAAGAAKPAATAPAGQAAMSYAGNQGGGAAKPAAPAAKPPVVAMEQVTKIKSFAEYLSEAELFEDIPSTGDVFEIEIAREEIVLESFVVGYMDDGIIVEADDTMMRILEHVGYLTENPTNMPPATSTTSPIHGGNDREIDEAEYQGRNVPLGKPMKGDVKKSKVYVKNAKGNVVKVNFGDPNMKIKKSNPKRRKSFRARHNCANPGPRTSARYWSCRAW